MMRLDPHKHYFELSGVLVNPWTDRSKPLF